MENLNLVSARYELKNYLDNIYNENPNEFKDYVRNNWLRKDRKDVFNNYFYGRLLTIEGYCNGCYNYKNYLYPLILKYVYANKDASEKGAAIYNKVQSLIDTYNVYWDKARTTYELIKNKKLLKQKIALIAANAPLKFKELQKLLFEFNYGENTYDPYLNRGYCCGWIAKYTIYNNRQFSYNNPHPTSPIKYIIYNNENKTYELIK